MTGRNFHSAITTYREIDGLLRHGDASKNWTPGQPLSILALTPALPLVEELEASQASLVLGWKWTYGAYSILTFILVTSLTTIAILYLTSLRRRIRQTARDLQGVEGSRSATKQIRITYQTLQWTIGAFAVLGCVFVSISLYSAVTPDSLQHPVTAEILVLGPLWAFAVCGLPTSVSLLWRAIDAKSTESERSGESSGSSRSRQRHAGIDPTKQYSIELNGRKSARGAVNVTVDVLVKEEGSELEKWESLSSASKL